MAHHHVASVAGGPTRAPAPSSRLHISTVESRALAPRDSAVSPQNSPGQACNCKKSKCLKLYCDCFSSGTTCGSSCKCQNCQNEDPNGAARALSMRNIVRRNPYAFKPKVRDFGGARLCLVVLGCDVPISGICLTHHDKWLQSACQCSVLRRSRFACLAGGSTCRPFNARQDPRQGL